MKKTQVQILTTYTRYIQLGNRWSKWLAGDVVLNEKQSDELLNNWDFFRNNLENLANAPAQSNFKRAANILLDEIANFLNVEPGKLSSYQLDKNHMQQIAKVLNAKAEQKLSSVLEANPKAEEKLESIDFDFLHVNKDKFEVNENFSKEVNSKLHGFSKIVEEHLNRLIAKRDELNKQKISPDRNAKIQLLNQIIDGGQSIFNSETIKDLSNFSADLKLKSISILSHNDKLNEFRHITNAVHEIHKSSTDILATYKSNRSGFKEVKTRLTGIFYDLDSLPTELIVQDVLDKLLEELNKVAIKIDNLSYHSRPRKNLF